MTQLPVFRLDRLLLAAAFGAWFCLVAHSAASLVAAQGTARAAYREGYLLIQPKPGADQALADFNAQQGTTVLRDFAASGNILLLSVPTGETVTNLIAQYEASGLVQFAEPDYIVHAACGPNDPMYASGSQWALWNYGQSVGKASADIDVVPAWSLRTSATNVTVAVLDTGVRWSHEDLKANLWTNPADGSFGTNAIAGTTDPWDDDSSFDRGHGSQMAGIIGAVGNNGLGVTGVAWQARIMACKFLDNNGDGFISDAIGCIEFARAHGAKIFNLSWGGTNLNLNSDGTNHVDALSNAVSAAQSDGVIFVAAAGNNSDLDNDVTPFYPASLPQDNIVAVAATSFADQLTDYSHYGKTNVDLAAPGGQYGFDPAGIYTTGNLSDSNYVSGAGTSQATAMVSGALALVWSQYPTNTYRQIIDRVLSTTDPLPSLAGKCVTGGRLNVRKALGVAGGTRPTVTFNCDGTNFTVKVLGTPCRDYVLEASTDLTNWFGAITNLTSDSGELDFTPDMSIDVQQFFRAYAEP